MLGVCDREHPALAEKLVIVFLGLGVEARVMIRVPGLRAGRRALHRFVEAANPTAAGIPPPVVVAAISRRISTTNQSLPTPRRWCNNWIEAEQPHTPCV